MLLLLLLCWWWCALQVQDRVDANTALDKMLYEAAVKHYNKVRSEDD